MNGYFLNFMIYTLAMVGVMLLSVVIYKKAMSGSFNSKKGRLIKIEESLGLSPKKTLYVVSVEDEKFLIASDADRTSFLAKLKEKNGKLPSLQEAAFSIVPSEKEVKTVSGGKRPVSKKTVNRNTKVVHESFSQILKNSDNSSYPVIRNLAKKIKRGI